MLWEAWITGFLRLLKMIVQKKMKNDDCTIHRTKGFDDEINVAQDFNAVFLPNQYKQNREAIKKCLYKDI